MSTSQDGTMFKHEEPSEVLLYQSHYPIRLSEAAIASFDTTAPSTPQKAQRLQAWFLQLRNQVDRRGEYATPLTMQLMKEGWKLLSKTFFLGSMDETPIAWDPDLLSRGNSWGVTSGAGKAVKVYIYPYLTAQNLLNTMLHEGAHAFISLHGCHNCIYGDEECVKQKGVSMGVRGHGLAWNMLAMAIERVSGVLFGFHLDLGRRSSSVGEHELLNTDRAVEALFGGVDPRRGIAHL